MAVSRRSGCSSGRGCVVLWRRRSLSRAHHSTMPRPRDDAYGFSIHMLSGDASIAASSCSRSNGSTNVSGQTPAYSSGNCRRRWPVVRPRKSL